MRSYWIILIAFACVYISQGELQNTPAVRYLVRKIVSNCFDENHIDLRINSVSFISSWDE